MAGVLRLGSPLLCRIREDRKEKVGETTRGGGCQMLFWGRTEEEESLIVWKEACLMMSGRRAWIVCTRMALHRKGGAREVDASIDVKNLSDFWRP